MFGTLLQMAVGNRQTPHAEYQTTECTLHRYTGAGPAVISKLGAEVHLHICLQHNNQPELVTRALCHHPVSSGPSHNLWQCIAESSWQ